MTKLFFFLLLFVWSRDVVDPHATIVVDDFRDVEDETTGEKAETAEQTAMRRMRRWNERAMILLYRYGSTGCVDDDDDDIDDDRTDA